MFEILPLDAAWDELIRELPGCHLLQTKEWAEIKAEVGWQAYPCVWKDASARPEAAALLLVRSVAPLKVGPRIAVGYIPRGPMLDWSDADLRHTVMADLARLARRLRLLFLKIDPELRRGTGVPGRADAWEDPVGQQALAEWQEEGWQYSRSQVQFKNTALLSLAGSEEEWLARMKQKSRYNLRLAQRSGVAVRTARPEEFPELYRMYAETSVRDHFVIRAEEYYLSVWQRFSAAGMLTPLVAEFDGQKIAGLMLFHFQKTAWYLYGMSTGLHREKMPNNLLQWEAMRAARAHGCERYDLWGAPDVFDESDSMFGVFRFKEGLGAEVLRTCGAWDLVIRPLGYTLYQQILPRILNVLRRNRNAETRQEIGA